MRRTGCSSGATRSELVVEGVVPDLLHVVPVGRSVTIPCSMVYFKVRTPLGLSLVSDIGILLSGMIPGCLLGAAHNGGEHGAWSVVASKASLAHTRSVINYESLHVFSSSYIYFITNGHRLESI